MSDRFEEDMLEDLAEAPEGASAMDEFDAGDEAEGFDEFDEFDEAEAFEDSAEDGFDEFEDAFDGDAADAMEEAVSYALEAEDADEFFGRIGRIFKKIGKGVGSVARTVAPIASMIPIPQAQLIGRAAGLIGKVLADEGDEFDALEELADYADEEEGFDALAPAIAGIAIRGALKHQAARVPPVQRKQLVKTVSALTRHIARKHGPRAVMAVPAIVNHARKVAIRRRLSAKHLPQLVASAGRAATASPKVLHKLASAGGRLRSLRGRYRGGYGTAYSGGSRGAKKRYGTAAYRTTGTPYRSGRTATYATGSSAIACPHCRHRTFRLDGPVTLTIQSR